MFLIGLIDICVVPCNGIIMGIQCIFGLHFCTNPKFFFLVATIACSNLEKGQIKKFPIFHEKFESSFEKFIILAGFYGVTSACIILAIDRFMEMCLPDIAKYVFNGKTIWIWMSLPIIYMLYFGFQLPHIYDVHIYSVNPDPFHKIPGLENNPGVITKKGKSNF